MPKGKLPPWAKNPPDCPNCGLPMSPGFLFQHGENGFFCWGCMAEVPLSQVATHAPPQTHP